MNVVFHTQIENNKHKSGFTLVEIIVVIVVISILTSIAAFGFNGIQDRAARTVLMADLNKSGKILNIEYIHTGSFPASAEEAAYGDGNGLNPSPGTTFHYTRTAADEFCLLATSNRDRVPPYYISSTVTTPTEGDDTSCGSGDDGGSGGDDGGGGGWGGGGDGGSDDSSDSSY